MHAPARSFAVIRRYLSHIANSGRASVAVAAMAFAVLLTGCYGPMHQSLEEELAEKMRAQHQQYLDAVADAPRQELDRTEPNMMEKLTPEQRKAILDMSGLESYRKEAVLLGKDLVGNENTPTVKMSLQRAIQLTVLNNLEVAQAKLAPAISEAQVAEAEAVFDAVFFSNLEYSNLDTPRPGTAIAAFGSQQTETLTLATGIRKPLTTGGQVSVETSFTRNDQLPSLFSGTGGRFDFYTADVLLSVNQPLLRNFGTDVNRSNILLARSAKKQSKQQLEGTLLQAVAAAEASYWSLVLARAQLLIQQRLLKRHLEDVSLVEKREGFDQSKAALMQARSFAENARTEVIRSVENVRKASDALKRLVNSEELPLAGETLIVPLDEPADLPVTVSLGDAVRTGLKSRPEVHIALMQINDATIRQRVADNLRLPVFNVGGGIRFNGLATDNAFEAYGAIGDGDFVDYLLNAAFELPIGNRGPEALYRRRQLERRSAVITYKNTAQQVVLEIKDALRDLRSAYELIGAARASRLAAAQNLRTFIVKIDAGVRPDEVFMDQKLRSEQRLAQAEAAEVQALASYNNAIAEFYRATGTLLTRSNIAVAGENAKK